MMLGSDESASRQQAWSPPQRLRSDRWWRGRARRRRRCGLEDRGCRLPRLWSWARMSSKCVSEELGGTGFVFWRAGEETRGMMRGPSTRYVVGRVGVRKDVCCFEHDRCGRRGISSGNWASFIAKSRANLASWTESIQSRRGEDETFLKRAAKSTRR